MVFGRFSRKMQHGRKNHSSGPSGWVRSNAKRDAGRAVLRAAHKARLERPELQGHRRWQAEHMRRLFESADPVQDKHKTC
jgi:hypothetical protein